MQFDFAYTLGKSDDNAPITGTLSVQGDAGRSNPEDLDFDRGPNVLDQRHTFTGSIVAQPRYDGDNAALRGLINGTVLGVAMQFASGIPINIRATGEINNDGIASDRPAGVPRNSLTLPARYNVDLRLSRQVPLGGRTKAEVIAEVKNLFNTVQCQRRLGNVVRRQRRRARRPAADQRRRVHAERRLRTATVPIRFQVSCSERRGRRRALSAADRLSCRECSACFDPSIA